MLRDNLAGLIEPMVDRAGAPPLGGHPKERPIGGCSRSTELAIVALQRSWRQIFRWETGRQAENGKWPDFEVTTAAHDSRAVSAAQHQSHRTIDPRCLENPRPEGAESTLTENAASPFQAEPTHNRLRLDEKKAARSHASCSVLVAWLCYFAAYQRRLGGDYLRFHLLAEATQLTWA